MKQHIYLAILLSACSSSNEQRHSTTEPSKDATEPAPLTYEEVQASLGQSSNDSIVQNTYWKKRQEAFYKDIYPKLKLSKTMNDFSACDSAELQRAYLNFSLVMNNYKDSGTMLLPYFRDLYLALDRQMDALDEAQRITIKDKLNINKTKSAINSAFAEIQMKSVTK